MIIIKALLKLLINILNFSIIAEVLMSYVPSAKESKFYDVIVSINNPILEPFRKLQDRLFGNSFLDFSPIFAILLLNIILRILVG